MKGERSKERKEERSVVCGGERKDESDDGMVSVSRERKGRAN